jgi:hypothetical protein
MSNVAKDKFEDSRKKIFLSPFSVDFALAII